MGQKGQNSTCGIKNDFFKKKTSLGPYINKSIGGIVLCGSWQKEQFIHKGKKIRFPVDFSEATLYVESFPRNKI